MRRGARGVECELYGVLGFRFALDLGEDVHGLERSGLGRRRDVPVCAAGEPYGDQGRTDSESPRARGGAAPEPGLIGTAWSFLGVSG